MAVHHLDMGRAQGWPRRIEAQPNQGLVVAEQGGAMALAQAQQIFPLLQHLAIEKGTAGAHLLAEQKHRRAGREQGEGRHHPHPRLGCAAGVAHQGCAVDRHVDGAIGAGSVAGLVMGFVIHNLAAAAGCQHLAKTGHRQRPVVTAAGGVKQARVAAVLVGVADQVVVEIGKPAGVKPHAPLLQRCRNRRPVGVVFRHQQHAGFDQPQGAAGLPQQLLAIDVGAMHHLAVGMALVVGVNRGGLVKAEAIDLEFAHQCQQRADEQAPHHRVPITRRPGGAHVVHIAAMPAPLGWHHGVEVGVVVGLALVPVIDVAFVGRAVELPLGPFGVVVVVVEHHIEDDGDAALMAGPDEVLVFIPSTTGIFDGEVVGGGVAPAGASAPGFGQGQQLHRIDAQGHQVVEKGDRIGEAAGFIGLAHAKAQGPHMQLIDHQVLQPLGPGRQAGLRRPETLLAGLAAGRQPFLFGIDVLVEVAADHIGILDHRSADIAGQIERTAPVGANGPLAAEAGLAAGVEVGAHHHRAVVPADAVQIGRMVKALELGQGRILRAAAPDTIVMAHQGKGPPAGVGAGAVVGHVGAADGRRRRRLKGGDALRLDDAGACLAVPGVRHHHLNGPGIWCPDRKADARRAGWTIAEQLLGAQMARPVEPIDLLLFRRISEVEQADGLAAVGLVQLLSYPPGGVLAEAQAHTPAEAAAHGTAGKADRRLIGQAAILKTDGHHRCGAEVVHRMAGIIPAAEQLSAAAQWLGQPRGVGENNGGHGVCLRPADQPGAWPELAPRSHLPGHRPPCRTCPSPDRHPPRCWTGWR